MNIKPNLIKEELKYLAKRGAASREIIMRTSLAPNERKEPPVFTAARAAELLRKSGASVGRVLRELGLLPATGGDVQRHSIDQAVLTKLIEHYRGGASEPNEGAIVLAVANQKGGVGKTTTVANLAPWAALNSIKTLVVDIDSQASFTAFMGLNADIEIKERETIAPILDGSEDPTLRDSLRSKIRKAPHIDNLWYVPSCLELANGDVGAYRKQFTLDEGEEWVFFNRLKLALDTVRSDYDLIILDCPPHISATTYNSVYAADMILVPLGAHMVDLASTLRFIEWLDMILAKLPGAGLRRIRFIVTNFVNEPASNDNLTIIKNTLGEHLMKVTAFHSSEIQRAAALFKSIYELPRHIGSREAWKRACETVDAVNQAVFEEVTEFRASDRQPAKTNHQGA